MKNLLQSAHRDTKDLEYRTIWKNKNKFESMPCPISRYTKLYDFSISLLDISDWRILWGWGIVPWNIYHLSWSLIIRYNYWLFCSCHNQKCIQSHLSPEEQNIILSHWAILISKVRYWHRNTQVNKIQIVSQDVNLHINNQFFRTKGFYFPPLVGNCIGCLIPRQVLHRWKKSNR